jgi:hypothetical protein
MGKTPEGLVKKAVKERLTEYGLVHLTKVDDKAESIDGFFFMPVAGPYSVHGIHDFVGCWHGMFFSIETKAPDNPEDHTAAQERFHTAVNKCGGISFTGVRDASAVDKLAEWINEHNPYGTYKEKQRG